MKNLILCASLCVALTTSAFAVPMEAESAKYWGSVSVNQRSATEVSTIVYDNITSDLSGANAGFTSTDLGATWGEPLGLVGTGVLSEHTFAIFNAGTSAGPLNSATATLLFYQDDNPNGLGTFIGGYQTNFSFTGGLPAGFFGTITVTGLEGLGIDLTPYTNIVVTQKLSGVSGGANRLGVVSFPNPIVGSNPLLGMYIDATTVGAPGYYTITSGGQPIPFHVANEIAVIIPEPSSIALGFMGLAGLALAGLRMRRSA